MSADEGAAGGDKKPGIRKAMREWAESLLFAGAIVAVMFAAFWPFVISGSSMQPGFYDRDRIAISRAAVWLGRYGRGDFVVCKMEHYGELEYVMKRVIGQPGDSVVISGGKVYVNGALLAEGYLPGGGARTDGEVNITLAGGEYFVMGDNRAVSFDSRHAGAVKAGDMIGRVIVKWYPFNKMAAYFG